MFKGYCFMVDGTHTPAVELKGVEEAFRYANLQKQLFYEVRIVDEDDYTVIHARKGKIIFPEIKDCLQFKDLAGEGDLRC